MQIAGTISATLVAFPLGLLADRIGRFPVLGASISSMLLSQGYAMFVCWQSDKIPLEAIWGIGVPLLFGGGRSVAEAMVFAVIADIVPEDKRSTWLQWVVASVLGAQLVGPVISGKFAHSSIWMPLFLSLSLISVGGLILVTLTPEILKQVQPQEDFTANIDPYTYGLELDNLNFELPKKASALATVKSMFSRPLIWLLPGAIMTIPLATTQTEIIIRLMPIQFDWPLHRSILILSLQSLVTLLTLCILLPVITYTWTKFSRSSAHFRYSILARSSSLLFFAGCLCMMMVTDESFVIAGLTIAALGSGLPTLCRAMLVGMVDKGRAGTLFGMLAVGEILGFLIFETSMGALFGVGLRSWIGMPFCLATAVAFLIALTALLAPMSLLTADDAQPQDFPTLHM
ncbi:major facilitator superfamily general substrate [Fusarium sporotrichioides]|uniref:Major facilitator superfamily general substrate n=1 Tax=Fusarium sporotrichioides TaxID=5514 RepID=A0A395SIK5_FUSSP|nr:major facilitator superfamily general substrate [Fusarium sporotrichioides]